MALAGFVEFFQKGKALLPASHNSFVDIDVSKNKIFSQCLVTTVNGSEFPLMMPEAIKSGETSGIGSSLQKKDFSTTKKFPPGTLRYSLHKHAQASLNSGIMLSAVVKLPSGEELNDWIAVHVVDFFNRINLIYGTISEWCTETSCPTMSGGHKFEYLWADGSKYKKPTQLPAPQYINLLMDWVENQINNETLFPVTTDIPFPKSFQPLCRKILTRLFRVFVHVYIHHFDRIVTIGAEPHVNTCYKHFFYFVREFDLISSKELEPLKEMTQIICKEVKL